MRIVLRVESGLSHKLLSRSAIQASALVHDSSTLVCQRPGVTVNIGGNNCSIRGIVCRVGEGHWYDVV